MPTVVRRVFSCCVFFLGKNAVPQAQERVGCTRRQQHFLTLESGGTAKQTSGSSSSSSHSSSSSGSDIRVAGKSRRSMFASQILLVVNIMHGAPHHRTPSYVFALVALSCVLQPHLLLYRLHWLHLRPPYFLHRLHWLHLRPPCFLHRLHSLHLRPPCFLHLLYLLYFLLRIQRVHV